MKTTKQKRADQRIKTMSTKENELKQFNKFLKEMKYILNDRNQSIPFSQITAKTSCYSLLLKCKIHKAHYDLGNYFSSVDYESTSSATWFDRIGLPDYNHGEKVIGSIDSAMKELIDHGFKDKIIDQNNLPYLYTYRSSTGKTQITFCVDVKSGYSKEYKLSIIFIQHPSFHSWCGTSNTTNDTIVKFAQIIID